MARPKKTGFTYWPFDVDLFEDDKVLRLKQSYGLDGICVYIFLLCKIYRDKGYFLRWDENSALGVADRLGLKETKVEGIVDFCLTVGLFDKVLRLREGVLTSCSIQGRFNEMSRRTFHRDAEIAPRYALGDENKERVSESETRVIESETRVIESETRVIESESTLNKNKVLFANAHNTPPPPPKKEEEKSGGGVVRLEDVDKDNEEEFRYTTLWRYWNNVVDQSKTSMRKVEWLTDSRREIVRKLRGKYSAKQIEKIFWNAANSDFCNGKTKKRKKPVEIDWVLSDDDRIVQAYEGTL